MMLANRCCAPAKKAMRKANTSLSVALSGIAMARKPTNPPSMIFPASVKASDSFWAMAWACLLRIAGFLGVELVDFFLKLPRHILGHPDVANGELGMKESSQK